MRFSDKSKLYKSNPAQDDLDQIKTDRQMQAFKGLLREMLSEERLMHPGKSEITKVIDRCSVALIQLMELHYDKRHQMDVIRRQQEEIDRLRNTIRDCGTLTNHLEDVKNVHDERIADLTTKLQKEQAKNKEREEKVRSKKTNIENIKQQTDSLRQNHGRKMKEEEACLNQAIGNQREKLRNLEKEQDQLKLEFEEAQQSTSGLKFALESARDKLNEAFVEAEVTVDC